MTPICCALIVRGTSSFLPIVRACANKVRSLSPLQRASAKPSISANNVGCLWTKAASLCRSALRLAFDLPAAVFGQGTGAQCVIPAPGPNAGPRIGLRCQRAGLLWLERNRAIGYFANVLGSAHRTRPVGDLNDDRRSTTHFADCVGRWLIEPAGFARTLGHAGC